VYQGPCQEGDFAANLATVRTVVSQARERGSQFLAFPECFLSGYEGREAVQRGARGLDDSELQGFIRESNGHDLVVLAGLARRSGTSLFNTVLVIHRGRLLAQGSLSELLALTSAEDLEEAFVRIIGGA